MSGAQTFEWVKNPPIIFSSNPSLISYVTTTDNSNNSYFAGFKDTAFLNSKIFGNVYLQKYNAAGTLLFSNDLLGKVNIVSMVCDNLDNLIVSASFNTTLVVGTTTIPSLNGSSDDQVILKFSPTGTLLWYKNLEPLLSGVEPCKAITVDSSNNIFIGYDNFFKSYATKLDSFGVVVLTITQLRVGILSSIAVDNLGNIFTAGGCAETNASFAGFSQNPGLIYNSYATKYDAAGTHQWTRFVKNITCDFPEIVVKSDNEIYFSGNLHGAYPFGTFTTAGPSSSSAGDFFITKLNGLGIYQWVREVPGTGGFINVFGGENKHLALDGLGNIYYCGETRGSIVWEPTISTATTANYNDALIVKYNPNGDVLLAKNIHGSFDCRFNSVNVAPDGSAYVTGVMNGSPAFDAVSSTGSGYYPVHAKLGAAVLSNIKSDLFSLQILPNPANDFIQFSSNNENLKGTIYNTLGQAVKQFETDNKIDIRELNSGVYLLQLSDNRVFRVVKE